MNGPLADDIRHAESMAQGSFMLGHAIKQARLGQSFATPRKLMWGGWGGNHQERQPSANRIIQDNQYAQQMARREFAETLRTNRDPCPLCAVRGDIGCKHSRRFA